MKGIQLFGSMSGGGLLVGALAGRGSFMWLPSLLPKVQEHPWSLRVPDDEVSEGECTWGWGLGLRSMEGDQGGFRPRRPQKRKRR